MKWAQLLALTAILSTNAFASTLNLDYNSIRDEVRACKKTMFGCTPEQEIEIAKFDGTILNSNELENYLDRDTEKSIFIPLELTNSELITLAAATSLGVVAFNHDQEIMDVVQRHKSQTTRTIADAGNIFGSTAFMPIAAGSYFLGVYFQDNRLKQVGLFIVGSSLAQSIVTESVKRTFGRARPRMNEGPYSFFQAGNKSFFSGHTAEAFTIATVISEMYKEDYPIVPWVAYGFATVTAYARMHDQAHWASDVLIGAVAGHLITKLAMNAFKGNPDERGGLEIYPSFDPSTGSIMVYANWTPKEHEAPLKCSKLPEGMAKVDACIKEATEKSARHF
jgi:membrane-associated phospholipid phosphatase